MKQHLYKQTNKKQPTLGIAVMVQKLRALDTVTQVQFQTSTCWLTTTCNSNASGYDALFWALWTLHTYAHTKVINKSLKNPRWQDGESLVVGGGETSVRM